MMALSEFQDAFHRNTDAWKRLLDDGRFGTEYAVITPEEMTVFQITPEAYPAMVALWEAYEAIKGICDFGVYPNEMCQAMRSHLGFPDHTVPKIDVAEFQRLGLTVGVSYRDAHAMFHKVKFQEIQEGVRKFKDETSTELPNHVKDVLATAKRRKAH